MLKTVEMVFLEVMFRRFELSICVLGEMFLCARCLHTLGCFIYPE